MEKELITYILPGDPVPLARARMSHKTKRVFDPQKQRKLYSGITIRSQHNERPFYDGPLILSVTFYMPIPKTRRNENLEDKPHIFKADLDNLIKWVCDVGNGILYKDDSIIAAVIAKKVYGNPARTEFTLRKLKI